MLRKPQPLKIKESRSETSNQCSPLTNLTVFFCIVFSDCITYWMILRCVVSRCIMLYWSVLSQLDSGGGSSHHVLRWIATTGDSRTTHVNILRLKKHAAHKKKKKIEWESQTGMCQWSTSTFENSCAYCHEHAGVKGNDRAATLAGKEPSQVACVWGDLKC